MIDPEDVLKARLNWVLFYEQTHNIDLTCRRCGISRPTLRKWWTRYKAEGEAGLRSRSRRPHKLRERKVMPEHEQLILGGYSIICVNGFELPPEKWTAR